VANTALDRTSNQSLEFSDLSGPTTQDSNVSLEHSSLPRPPIGRRGGLIDNAAAVLAGVGGLIAGVASAPSASGATIRSDVPLSSYVSRADSMLEAQSVGGLTIEGLPGASGGVYIGDGLFATDLHSLVTSGGALRTVSDIRFGSSVLTPDATFSIDSIFLHPDGVGAGRIHDFALIYSEGLRDSTIPSLELANTRLSLGTVVDIVTFGKEGVIGQSSPFGDPNFRVAGQNKALNPGVVGDGFWDDLFDVGGPGVPAYEIGGAPGVSGSPAIYDGKVYGLANYTVGFPNPFFATGYEYTANNYEFAESIRAQVTVPEPTTAVGVAVGGAGLLLRRRKQ